MIKLGVLTTTRAEYGLLRTLIFALEKVESIKVELLVTGTHLSKEFGNTYKEIEKDNIRIATKIEILSGEDSNFGVSKTMANAIIEFSKYFSMNTLDGLIVLGDRYETLAVCIAAQNFRIPIIHLHGGETTEGALDEAIRHSITKMSYLHFTSTETYRKRVIQLGESPKRVFNVGAIGVENAMTLDLMTKNELENSIGIDLGDNYIVSIFHPVTLENNFKKQVDLFLKAIDCFPNVNFLMIKANADVGGEYINNALDLFVKKNDNAYLFDSLSVVEYLSAVKNAKAVIGNSSSGIIEVPSFGVPVVNVGNRQKGRIHSDGVIDCSCETKDIVKSINMVLSDEFQIYAKTIYNPYGDGKTSEKIVKEIVRTFESEIDLKKKFYDIDFEV